MNNKKINKLFILLRNGFRKSFTLIEIIIVLIIIWILLLILLKLWKNYLLSMQFRSDKEEFVAVYNKVLSQSISSSYYYGKKYDNLKLEIDNKKENINIDILSWNNFYNVEQKKLYYSYFSWISFDWNNYDKWKIIFKPYKEWCMFDDGMNSYWTWTVKINLSTDYIDKKYCFSIDLLLCKLIEYKCF